MGASMNISQKAPDLSEFGGAIAKSLDCMVVSYPGHAKLLLWSRELLDDAIETNDLTDDQALQLRSEVWQRLKPATQAVLQALKQRQEAA